MRFDEVLSRMYYQPVIQDLEGDIYADLYPSVVGKCQHFHDGFITIRGQTFHGCLFKNLTILGGGIFMECTFKDCQFLAPIGPRPGEAVLSIFNGSLTDCTFNGFYHKFDFLPQFCERVYFSDGFKTLDLSTKFNCATWGGIELDSRPAALLMAFILRSAKKKPTQEELDLAERNINHLLERFSEHLEEK